MVHLTARQQVTQGRALVVLSVRKAYVKNERRDLLGNLSTGENTANEVRAWDGMATACSRALQLEDDGGRSQALRQSRPHNPQKKSIRVIVREEWSRQAAR